MNNMKNENIYNYFPFTPISNYFIENHMIQANPIFVVIYIFILNKTLKSEHIKISEAIKEFDILESDIIKCLEYWQKKSLIEYKIEEDALYVNFIEKQENIPPKIIVQKEKSYSDEEISFYSKQEEIQQLFKIAENKLAKTLSHQDRKKIIELYDGYSINMEIFAILLTYCKEKNKCNFNYIEKVALDWCENGIDSSEKADEYIKMYDEKYKKIMYSLGLRNQEPAPNQIKYMKKWITELKLPIELIEKACNKTMTTIGKPNFDYVEKILISWLDNNIKTLDDVEQNNEKFKIEKQMKNEEMKKRMEKLNQEKKYFKPYNNDKFVNYEQPNLDFKKLREYEIKSLKGEI